MRIIASIIKFETFDVLLLTYFNFIDTVAKIVFHFKCIAYSS